LIVGDVIINLENILVFYCSISFKRILRFIREKLCKFRLTDRISVGSEGLCLILAIFPMRLIIL